MSNDISTPYTKNRNKTEGRTSYFRFKREKETAISPKHYGIFIANRRRGNDMSLVKKIKVWDEKDSSSAQHDEYRTDCYCSECGEYLGSTDFTYRVAHINEIDKNMKFCPYCGSPL